MICKEMYKTTQQLDVHCAFCLEAKALLGMSLGIADVKFTGLFQFILANPFILIKFSNSKQGKHVIHGNIHLSFISY